MTVTIKWWQNKVVTNSVIIASNFLTGDGDFIIADRRPVPLSDHHRKFMIHHAARLLQRDVVFFLFFSPFLFFFFFLNESAAIFSNSRAPTGVIGRWPALSLANLFRRACR